MGKNSSEESQHGNVRMGSSQDLRRREREKGEAFELSDETMKCKGKERVPFIHQIHVTMDSSAFPEATQEGMDRRRIGKNFAKGLLHLSSISALFLTFFMFFRSDH